MPGDSYTEGYLKGYEEGLNEAWNDVVKLTKKGLSSREIAIRANAVIGTIYQKLDGKRHELQKAEIAIASAPMQKKQVLEPVSVPIPVDGICYLVRETRPERILKIFSQASAKGQKGLCISRTEPGIIKNSVRGSNITFLWLTKSEEMRCQENCLPPDLSQIQLAIKQFMEQNKSGVILLDGLYYLVTQTEFSRVLRFVQSIRDEVSTRKFSLIANVDPGTMQEREFRQLEAEMQPI